MIILTETRKIKVDVNIRMSDGWMSDIITEDLLESLGKRDDDKSWDLGDNVHRMTDKEADETYEWLKSNIADREEVQAQAAKDAEEDPERAEGIWQDATSNEDEGIPYLSEGEEYWWSWNEEDYDPKEDKEEDED